jgi:hypothetical protein
MFLGHLPSSVSRRAEDNTDVVVVWRLGLRKTRSCFVFGKLVVTVASDVAFL